MALKVRGQVIGVPPQFADDIDAIHFELGVPRSWLAASCELTSWNPFFETLNVYSASRVTVRRFGIAGLWADIREVTILNRTYDCNQHAGWFDAYQPEPFAGKDYCNAGSICLGFTRQNVDVGITVNRQRLEPWYPVRDNMRAAGRILLDSAQTIQALCGQINTHAVLRWMWGCSYIPIDPITGDPTCNVLPEGLPTLFLNEINTWVATQRIYADIFNEPPILVEPLVVSLSANRTTIGAGESVTFQANISGGSGGNVYQWTFGDGQTAETQNPTVDHVYEAVGAYSARVVVQDRVGAVGQSPLLLITVREAPVAGGFPWWVILIGAAGVVGLAGLLKKNKRQQAAEKRQQAQRLRLQAQQARLQGNMAKATQLEQQATRLEQEATQLEQQATQEEALQRQLQQRR